MSNDEEAASLPSPTTLTDEELQEARETAAAAMEDPDTRNFFERIAGLMQKTLFEFFLLPRQQQDQIIRSMRPLVTDNSEQMKGFLAAMQTEKENHVHSDDCEHDAEQDSVMDDRAGLALEILDAVDPAVAADEDE